ncbi:MAG: N-acetyltransferase [Proteobacteria bacterium]|nr:N-acetyltransferase [Pseudomonadota bacterium]
MARKRTPNKTSVEAAVPAPATKGSGKPSIKPSGKPAGKPPGKAPKVVKVAKPAKASSVAKPEPTKAGKNGKPGKGGKAELKPTGPFLTVRHMNRRDINRVWDFLKVSFREVNAETVEFQRPRSKQRFEEIFAEQGIDQLVFEIGSEVVAYAECSYEVLGTDNWINPRYFEKRDMRPLFIDELAVHPEMHGRGVGSFLLEQLHHIARVHGLNTLVLEVAENNENALNWYKKRSFKKLDAAIFMACSVELEDELLPPRSLPAPRGETPPPASGANED